MTITIDLDGPGLVTLSRIARDRGCTVEQLAGNILADFVRAAPAELDPALARAVADSFAENDELYRRLAK